MESMIKPYKELDSIGKKVRTACMKQRCSVCQYAKVCNIEMSEACSVIYEKGFRKGYNKRKEEEKCKKN